MRRKIRFLIIAWIMMLALSSQSWAFDLDTFYNDNTFICNINPLDNSGSIYLDNILFTISSDNEERDNFFFIDIENFSGIGWELILGIEQIVSTTQEFRTPTELVISTSSAQYIFEEIQRECIYDGTGEDDAGAYVYRDTMFRLGWQSQIAILTDLITDALDGYEDKYTLNWDDGRVENGTISYEPIGDLQRLIESYTIAGGFEQGLENYDLGYKFSSLNKGKESRKSADEALKGIEKEIVYTDAATIKEVQQMLNSRGYNCGVADGIAGANTDNAIKQFQRTYGLEETGEITDSFLRSLEVVPTLKPTNTPTPKPQETRETSESYQGTMVWIPNSGSKYHSRSSCSNMKNPNQVTESAAIAWGYGKCKKCW